MLVLCCVFPCYEQRLLQYRAQAVVLLSPEWVFGDTFRLDSKVTVPALFYIDNLRVNADRRGQGGDKFGYEKMDRSVFVVYFGLFGGGCTNGTRNSCKQSGYIG